MKSSLTEKWIVCRICLKQPKESMQTIFNKNDDKDLTRMILDCGGVPIKRFDHYPDKICSKCLNCLRVAYKFRVTCQRSYKHLSKFIAPVVVDKADSNDANVQEMSLDMDDNVAVALKLDPEEVQNINSGIKQEVADDDDDVIATYEPMDETEFEDFQELKQEDLNMPEDLEYVELEAEIFTSDEDFVPNAKPARKKRKYTKRSLKLESQKASTSRRSASDKFKQPPKKRGPKTKRTKTTFICDVCGNIYPSQGRLTEHIKLHKGIKPHDCEICGHAFAQNQQLARHMNTHTGNRPFKCNYCPSAFADLSTRNKHHRIHTNERPYVCDVCGKAFSYTNTLKFHKMIHTGEKPHVCDICGKGFQQAYKLRNHKVTHEKRGIKVEKIEVETLANFQEASLAAAQILEI